MHFLASNILATTAVLASLASVSVATPVVCLSPWVIQAKLFWNNLPPASASSSCIALIQKKVTVTSTATSTKTSTCLVTTKGPTVTAPTPLTTSTKVTTSTLLVTSTSTLPVTLTTTSTTTFTATATADPLAVPKRTIGEESGLEERTFDLAAALHIPLYLLPIFCSCVVAPVSTTTVIKTATTTVQTTSTITKGATVTPAISTIITTSTKTATVTVSVVDTVTISTATVIQTGTETTTFTAAPVCTGAPSTISRFTLTDSIVDGNPPCTFTYPYIVQTTTDQPILCDGINYCAAQCLANPACGSYLVQPQLPVNGRPGYYCAIAVANNGYFPDCGPGGAFYGDEYIYTLIK